MQVRLFGELEAVTAAGQVLVRGAKQRALLALLALERGQPVSADRLIDVLWGDGQVVRAAASRNPRRAADLLREHLAEVGCDPLAVRVAAWLRPSEGEYDAADLPGRLPACHAALWRHSP